MPVNTVVIMEQGRLVKVDYLADVKRNRLIAAGLLSPDGVTPQRWVSKPTLRLLGTEDHTAPEPPGFAMWCYDRDLYEEPWQPEQYQDQSE